MSRYKISNTCVNVEFFKQGSMDNNVYIIADGDQIAIIDPCTDAHRIVSEIDGREVAAIIITHGHYDHMGAAADLREVTGAKVYASAIDAVAIESSDDSATLGKDVTPCPVDVKVADGDIIEVGSIKMHVIATPGHTKGGISLFIDQKETENPTKGSVVITGDTLFDGTWGRTDFPGGSREDMHDSLQKLAELPNDTLVCPGHNGLTSIALARGTFWKWGSL